MLTDWTRWFPRAEIAPRFCVEGDTLILHGNGNPACFGACLNGPQFLADDATPGPLRPLPTLSVPVGPGLGVSPDPEKLARYTREPDAF